MKSKPGQLSPVPENSGLIAGARKLALDYMLAALDHLDSDDDISPLVGAQLQLAIDRLAAEAGENWPLQ